MTNEQRINIIKRYNRFCLNFIQIAEQVKQIEESNSLELDLKETKDTMWRLLDQIVINKPGWIK